MLVTELLFQLFGHWVLLSLVSFISYHLYNKFGHGINRFPGPTIAAYTHWWRFFDVLGRRAQHTHIKLHRQHGDIVRLGPNVLSFADPQAIKDIYGLNKGFTKVRHVLLTVVECTTDGRWSD